MKVEAPFIVRQEATEQIIRLIEKTPLGTNGAVYWHLNTREVIHQLDEPFFITLERNENCIANMTVCKRNDHRYIRYFVFDQLFQSVKKGNKPSSKRNFKFKIADFFENELQSDCTSFYAYVEPQNNRSQWMRENFGFISAGNLQTQTFSRLTPKVNKQVQEITTKHQQKEFLLHFKQEAFFTDTSSERMQFFALKNEVSEVIAFCRVQVADWKIERLGGKWGKTLVSALPYLPLVRKLIQPKELSFLVADAVFVKEEHLPSLQVLFESILAIKKKKVLFWWSDQKNPVLKNVQNKIKWGLMDRIFGRPAIDVVVKSNDPVFLQDLQQKPFFVNGIDLI